MMRLRRLATCYVAIIVGSALVVVVEPLVAEKSHTSVVQGGMKYELMKRTRTTKSRESSSLLSSTNCASSFLKVRKSRDVEEDITLVSSSRRAVLGVAVSTGLMCWGRINLQPAKANDNDDDVIGIRQPSSTTATAVAMTTTVLADAATTPAAPTVAAVEWKVIFQKASQKAWSGGRAGASAAVVQVSSLMWLRTSMNYQYRYGGNLQSSLQTLWNEGGIARLYQGLPFALIQGPLTRFGDTAANVGILALLDALPVAQEWPLPLKTACGSAAAGLWRILLMPIDASKTSMQVEGSAGLERLWTSAVDKGPSVLYRGALAQAAATAVGHFPWFLTYNFLNELLPVVDSSSGGSDSNALLLSLARSAFLGFSASCVSDCSSNSLRVIKTTKQTAQLGGSSNDNDGKELSYPDVINLAIEKDGVAGLFGRGLQTRLLTNAIQGAMFSILWQYFQQANGV